MSVVSNFCCSTAKIITEYCVDLRSKDAEKDKIQHILICLFKQHVLGSFGYERYIINSDLHIQNMRKGGRGNGMTILTYSDGSEWIHLNDGPEERFCGFLYLESAMQGAQSIVPALNKMAWYSPSRCIIYLSQYCGETRLTPTNFFGREQDCFDYLIEAGVKTIGCANLRLHNNTVYVIDTEKSSFRKEVHSKIDAFRSLHVEIRSLLETA